MSTATMPIGWMSMEKNKKNYYNKNNHKNNYQKKNKKKEIKEEKNKVTYDSLIHADTITEVKNEPQYNKVAVMKAIALSIIVFAIIICSLILFSKM